MSQKTALHKARSRGARQGWPYSGGMSLILPDLLTVLDRAADAAAALVAELKDAVAARCLAGGRLDRAALDREQHAAHGLAWAAAYAETLRQTAA